ncbi:hypothetical protein [Occultella kanbiaonis]|uniref:hypothetical protein n=1 Tax=Occultella kanbiaonis TaxID=2675754 RepID=UPI0013D6AA79|nr:hypothetical protein [Occultella kanbiaonis]
MRLSRPADIPVPAGIPAAPDTPTPADIAPMLGARTPADVAAPAACASGHSCASTWARAPNSPPLTPSPYVAFTRIC